jgi:hypothetical protein
MLEMNNQLARVLKFCCGGYEHGGEGRRKDNALDSLVSECCFDLQSRVSGSA